MTLHDNGSSNIYDIKKQKTSYNCLGHQLKAWRALSRGRQWRSQISPSI